VHYGSCYVYVCMTEAADVHSRPVRSASDDQLLSHSEAFNSTAAGSRLRCDSDHLTQSDDIETMRRPTCSHDVPENCSASCWTFADCADAAGQQCQVPQHHDIGKTESWPCINDKLPMTKSKSTEHCYLHEDDVTDQSPVNRAACFHPASSL